MTPIQSMCSQRPLAPDGHVGDHPPDRDTGDRLIRAEAVAVGHLAAGAAYELEGPLARIRVSLKNAASLLLAEGEHELLQSLEDAARATEELEATVRGLRALASVDDDPQGVDVHDAIELAVSFAARDIGTRATLRRQYGPTPRAQGSVAGLARALLALLRNAAEAIPRSTPWANAIVVQTGVTAGGAVAIDVVDTGVGIEPEDLPFVFDPFFTTKPTPSSPGLGLAAARAAILGMGGTIGVESTVGRGSCFRVRLPAGVSNSGEEAGALPISNPLEERATRRVLCVAESAADAKRLRDLIGESDAEILSATCAEALERLAVGELFDLVLCESRAAARLDFRENLARLAPYARARTFDLTVRSSPSGTFDLSHLGGLRCATGSDGNDRRR